MTAGYAAYSSSPTALISKC